MSPKSKKRQEFTGITPPIIGEILEKHLRDNRLYQSGWARKQGVKPDTIAKYFKKKSMQTSTLFTICQVLGYNFLRVIADALPADMPPHPVNPLQERVDELEKENKQLKTENEILKKVIANKL